jgi:TetR/AcrR family transcriptional regulator, mexJK operon transcriptional repressor
MRQYLINVIEQAIANQVLKPCDSNLAAGHLYGMIMGFDVFMSRFSNNKLNDKERRFNVVIAVDAFLASYS